MKKDGIEMKKDLRTDFSTRQYMLSKDFEVFYYSDVGLSNLKSHSHDYYEFYFFLEGNVRMHIEDQIFTPTPGSLMVIPPRKAHFAKIMDTAVPYRRFVFWLSLDYCKGLSALSSDYLFLTKKADAGENIFHFESIEFNSIQSKVFSLIEEVHGDRFGREARLSLCVNDLLLHMGRLVYENEHQRVTDTSTDLYNVVLAYIEEHLDDDLSLDLLSKVFFVSKYHISHIFTDNMGISIHKYITKKRLASCADAIKSGTPVNTAAASHGFSDYSSFYRAFMKEYGCSPTAMRQAALLTLTV